MARPRKVPAVLIEATVRRNAKLAALPSDTARLGYFYLLGDAKLSEPVPGQFASRAVFRDVAGRWARYLDDYIKQGLLEVAPKLCPRCKERWAAMPPRTGALVVHDWHEHQYDPRKLDRQREYEDRQRAEKAPVEDDVSDGVSDAQSDGVSDAVSDANPTGISRASARGGGRRRAPNVERRTENESGSLNGVYPAADVQEPTFTKAQLKAWASFGSEWDDVRAAWVGRGFRHPPSGEPDDATSQRGLLYPILDARPTTLPQWIREAKGKTAHEVIGHVLERWHAIQAEAGVDDELAAWTVPTRDEAAATLGEILAKAKT